MTKKKAKPNISRGIQFYHEQGFGLTAKCRTPSSMGILDNETKRSARDVLGEALRQDGYHQHVDQPHPPVFIYEDGDALLKSEAEVMDWWELHRKKAEEMRVPYYLPRESGRQWTTRKQRSDTSCILGCIASWPENVEPTDAGYAEFKKLTLKWAKARYGSMLRAVISHDDEPYLHIHIIVAGDGESMNSVHAGHRAQDQARKMGADKKAAAIAYKSAESKLQDQFFAVVGTPLGLRRSGLHPTMRLPRGKALQRKEKKLALRERNVRKRDDEQEVRDAEFAARLAKLVKREADLTAMESAFRDLKNTLIADNQRQKEELANLEHEISMIKPVANGIGFRFGKNGEIQELPQKVTGRVGAGLRI
jgi:hypothetical protein